MWRKVFLLWICVLGVYDSSRVDRGEFVVATDYGKVVGNLIRSRDGRNFSAFRGIPYAKPPVGNLRFKAPEEPTPWADILDATQNAPICIQQNYLFSKQPKLEGSEDCLYINIYTPLTSDTLKSIQNENPLPVMVAFHYGAFMAGSSSSDLLGPEYLMDKEVVLVTFNYRLGIFGFLSTYDDAAPGNWAFKDQVAALRWVQSNIRAFGGDPQKVTIFGASAGAGSIHHHILSPLSKGLFQAAITQSGSALALWAQPQRELGLTVAKIQADIVGCSSNVSTVEIVDCLRQIPAEALVESMNLFRFMRSEPLTPYLPAIEFKTENNLEPFITRDPIEIIESGEFSNVPWIIGVTSSEGTLRAAPFVRQTDLLEQINSNFSQYFIEMLVLRLSVTEEDLLDTWAKIKEFYFLNNEGIDVNDPGSIQGLINVYSDRGFLYPTYQMSLLHKHRGHDNIWVYYFDYRGNGSYGDIFAATDNQVDFQWGVSHCDDLLYLFRSPQLFPNFELIGSDKNISNLMVNLFTNFATYLDPTPQTLYEENVRWKSLESTEGNAVMENKDLRYLNLSGSYNYNTIQISMLEEFHPSRMSFWIKLPLSENIDNLS